MTRIARNARTSKVWGQVWEIPYRLGGMTWGVRGGK